MEPEGSLPGWQKPAIGPCPGQVSPVHRDEQKECQLLDTEFSLYSNLIYVTVEKTEFEIAILLYCYRNWTEYDVQPYHLVSLNSWKA